MDLAPTRRRPEWPAGSLLARLSPASRNELLTLGTTRPFPPGRRLFQEGDRDNHVELLRRGFVKVTSLADGRETLLSIRVPGNVLGELGAVSGEPRSATVTTCGVVISSRIDRAVFERFLRRHPDAALLVTAMVGQELHWANQRRTDFAAYPAPVRLARVLAEIADACGEPTENGLSIRVELSQSELATMIGTADVTVQKAVRALRRAGLIRTGYRQITVNDIERLRARAAGDG
jgi:CRP/FNR family transcriptional regulator, cyclic AMP receptor protein